MLHLLFVVRAVVGEEAVAVVVELDRCKDRVAKFSVASPWVGAPQAQDSAAAGSGGAILRQTFREHLSIDNRIRPVAEILRRSGFALTDEG